MIAYLYDICRKNQPSFSQAYTAYKIHAPHYTYIYIYTNSITDEVVNGHIITNTNYTLTKTEKGKKNQYADHFSH